MKVESEPDQVDRRFVVVAGAASLLVTVLCCLLAQLVLSWSSSDGTRTLHQVRATKPLAEVDRIEADLLDGKRAPAEVASARRRLESFGWSEPARGLVHIPIQRAFELYQAGARASAAPSAPMGKP